MLATAHVPRLSDESLAISLKSCPWCCADIPRQAKKCQSCSEWVVGTSGGFSAAILRLLALAWAGITVLTGFGLWTLGQGVRAWVWMHATDPMITPRVVDLALYAVIAMVVLKGLMVSVGLGVMARLSPQRPRWWS